MDRLWRELKYVIAANCQFPTITSLVVNWMLWVLMLSLQEAGRKAAVTPPAFLGA
jgi:hypothetical protein